MFNTYTDFRAAYNDISLKIHDAKEEIVKLEKEKAQGVIKAQIDLTTGKSESINIDKEIAIIDTLIIKLLVERHQLFSKFPENFNLLHNVSDLCTQNGLTIAELERELGLSNSSIRRWGKSMPSLDKVVKLADYFDVTIDSLLDRKLKYLPEVYVLDEILTRNTTVKTLGKQNTSAPEDDFFLSSTTKRLLLSMSKHMIYESDHDLFSDLGYSVTKPKDTK